MIEHTPEAPPRYRNLSFIFARFNDALANPNKPSNPDSAIHVQFIGRSAVCYNMVQA